MYLTAVSLGRCGLIPDTGKHFIATTDHVGLVPGDRYPVGYTNPFPGTVMQGIPPPKEPESHKMVDKPEPDTVPMFIDGKLHFIKREDVIKMKKSGKC